MGNKLWSDLLTRLWSRVLVPILCTSNQCLGLASALFKWQTFVAKLDGNLVQPLLGAISWTFLSLKSKLYILKVN